jgi:hypothetical protein
MLPKSDLWLFNAVIRSELHKVQQLFLECGFKWSNNKDWPKLRFSRICKESGKMSSIIL